jgi:Zn-dependent metalloprotease
MRCTFLPPHMLRALAASGDSEQRDRAHASLELSAQFRGERAAVGQIASLVSVAPGQLRRTIYDARHGRDLPGKLARGEDSAAVADVVVNEAYDAAGKTYDFYRRVLGRNSLDDRGLRLEGTVRFAAHFDNAQWNGRQMVYGDGDGKLFVRFTRCIDVVAHELTHGVTQYSAALAYRGETGALNEHFSDVFGVLVKQHTLKQSAAKADWLIGAGLFSTRVNGVAVRSMKAPGTGYDDAILGRDPQPSHMRDYKGMHDDNGGVHVNSGIPNHAFYLTAIALGGKAWEVPGRIWYAALTRKLHPRATFSDCARATISAASELYGVTSEPRRAVEQAWRSVGVDAIAVADAGPRLPIFEPAAELPTLLPTRRHAD